jgi:hypothetical protein
VIALAVVLYQPFAVFGADDFTMTPDGYKVFRFGFPFRIVDCAAHLPMHMAAWQVALRFIGNFAVFFLCGALIMQAIRRVRAPQTQREPL